LEINKLAELYQYLDDLVCQDVSSDDLFASSYLRGFISLAASEFGDESQLLAQTLAEDISKRVDEAKTELTPADRVIVNNYWQQLKTCFKH
jgi:hypothetical protein